MKTRKLLSILILVLAVLIINSSCATTPKTQEEREGVNQEVFFQSVRSGDYDEVKKLIELGADVDAQTKDRLTALMYASANGHIEIARLLIEKGADVYVQSNDGLAALMVASQEGHPDVAKLLIDAALCVSQQRLRGLRVV